MSGRAAAGGSGHHGPGRPRAHPRRRTWGFRIGLVLLLAGVGVLAYVAWELYGTTYVSQRRSREIVGEVEKQWRDPGSASTIDTGHGSAGAILRIPAFGADYAVPVIEGTDDDALASGLGHYDGTAGPGGAGNFALAGHRITHGQPLADLPDLGPGDTVLVETRDRTYTYVLDTGGTDLRVPFTEGWVLDPVPVDPDGPVGPDPRSRRLLTLTTCAELFHTDDRYVVFGHLVSTTAPSRR